VPGTAEEPPTAFFRDVTASVGVNFAYRNGEEAGHFAILEEVGGGLAALDFDGDGRLDLFVTGGGWFDGPDKKQIKGHPCKLYRNVRDPAAPAGFRFEDVTDRADLGGIDFYTHGAAVGDFDNDGWPDLLVTGWGRLALFHNEPVDPADPGKGRRFVDVTKRAGLPAGLWTTGAAWGDLDGDGYPDLYVCQYVDWSFERNHPTDCVAQGGRERDVCAPNRFAGLPHKLFRNRGDGTFEDVSPSAGIKPGRGLGVLFIDINGDGKPDVYVANDMEDKFLYVNRSAPGRLRFEEQAVSAGAARDDRGLPNGSMGLDAADYDGSGRPALWVTNYAGELQALYRNECRPGQECFLHASKGAGIAAIGLKTVGWGTGFLDLDHHGWEDIVLTAGDAYRHSHEFGRAQKPVLLRNQGGGKFKDVSASAGPYFQATHVGRGLVLADFDNDGRTDLVISHLNEPITVLHNEADTGGRHWLGIELVGADHRDVVGARIVAEAGGRRQTHFVKGGGSYLSSCDRRHVFGLASAGEVERVRVVWPSGAQQEWRQLGTDRYWRLIEGEERPVPLYQER
jgi:hypothetical protein